jgi:hypothetical protein
MPERLTMPAEQVSTRRDLEEYLGQALLDEYYIRQEGRIVRQVSTLLKTYIIELHLRGRRVDEWLRPAGFARVFETREASLFRVQDVNQESYFIDALDKRFPLIHTIERTNHADAAVHRMVRRGVGVDTCWFPTRLMMHPDLGQAIGFRLFFQHGLDGLPEGGEAADLARELGKSRPPAFRLAVSDMIGADDDLRALQEHTVFGNNSALDSMSWRSKGAEPGTFIHDEVWYHGKVSGYGTSWHQHLQHVLSLRDRYARVLHALESRYAIRVVDSGLVGEPVEIAFPPESVVNVLDLAENMADPSSPMRLWGAVTPLADHYAVLDAVDLHTGHRLSIELSPSSARAYLRTETCGNVLLRLLVHLERHVAAQLETSIDQLLGLQAAQVEE